MSTTATEPKPKKTQTAWTATLQVVVAPPSRPQIETGRRVWEALIRPIDKVSSASPE